MKTLQDMTDEERNIFFMQKYKQYKSDDIRKINCSLQYPSWCSSCNGKQSYTSISWICLEQVLYTYWKETGTELSIEKLQHRTENWQNIYTI